jgi:hypothetical protein
VVVGKCCCHHVFARYGQKLRGEAVSHNPLLPLDSFSLLLAVDDFFMLHDRYINQLICYALYAVVTGLILIRHFKAVMASQGTAFLLATTFLGLSIVSDLVKFRLPFSYEHAEVMEEGFKFIGAAT